MLCYHVMCYYTINIFTYILCHVFLIFYRYDCFMLTSSCFELFQFDLISQAMRLI